MAMTRISMLISRLIKINVIYTALITEFYAGFNVSANKLVNEVLAACLSVRVKLSVHTQYVTDFNLAFLSN